MRLFVRAPLHRHTARPCAARALGNILRDHTYSAPSPFPRSPTSYNNNNQWAHANQRAPAHLRPMMGHCWSPCPPPPRYVDRRHWCSRNACLWPQFSCSSGARARRPGRNCAHELHTRQAEESRHQGICSLPFPTSHKMRSFIFMSQVSNSPAGMRANHSRQPGGHTRAQTDSCK